MNDQRKAVFEQRQEFMEPTDLSEMIGEIRHDTDRRPGRPPPAAQGLCRAVGHRGPGRAGAATSSAWTCRSRDWAAEEGIANEEIEERIVEAAADARAAERLDLIGAEQMRGLEKNFLLQMIDMQWREHLMHLDHLRNVIGLRGYGQRDPLNEYKTEAFTLFEKLLVDLRQNVTRWLMTVEFRFAEPEPLPDCADFQEIHLEPADRRERGRTAWPRRPGRTSTADQRAALPVSALPAGWERTARNADLPLRLGQEVQALPRRAGLTRPAARTISFTIAGIGRHRWRIPLKWSMFPVGKDNNRHREATHGLDW